MRSQRRLNIIKFYALEVFVMGVCFFVGYWIRSLLPIRQRLAPLEDYIWLILSILVIWSALLWLNRSYVALRLRGLWEEVWLLAKVQFAGTVLIFATVSLVKAHYVNRSVIGFYVVLSFVFLLVIRQLTKGVIRYYSRLGYDRRFVLVVGSGPKAHRVAQGLQQGAGPVYEVKGIIGEGDLKGLSMRLEQDVIDEVIFAPEREELAGLEEAIVICQEVGVKVRWVADILDKVGAPTKVERLGPWRMLTFGVGPGGELLFGVKRGIDIAVSGLLLVALWPLLLIISIAIKLGSKGPVLFRQERVGMHGRVFTLYKFRTMYEGAEAQRSELERLSEVDGPVFKIRKDPRVTRVGRVLRRLSLDELPQLWNVFKGDMSLVGPRPLPVYEVAKFERRHRKRMSMRPGLTCFWQIDGRSDLSFDQWMQLDLKYIDEWSLLTDLKILLKTIPATFSGRGAY
jgi:exopolysaccharide biosynthesis polyprenyl glycosylphosphotransferase